MQSEIDEKLRFLAERIADNYSMAKQLEKQADQMEANGHDQAAEFMREKASSYRSRAVMMTWERAALRDGDSIVAHRCGDGSPPLVH